MINIAQKTISLNDQITQIRKRPPLKIAWDLNGHVISINHPSYFQENIIGKHFLRLNPPLIEAHIFETAVEEKQIQYLTIKTSSINPEFSFTWAACLEPVIKNNKICHLNMTAILLNSDKKKDHLFSHHWSEEHYDRKTLYSKTGYWEWDFKTDEIIWSDETWKLFNLDKTKFVANYESYMSQIHPEDQAIVASHVEGLLKNGKPYVHHIRIHPTSNFSVIVECRGYLVKNSKGEAIKLMGTIQDITKNIQLENQYQQKYHLLNLVTKNSPGMVAQAELLPDGRLMLTFVSDACKEIYGLTPQEMLGNLSNIIKLTHPDDIEKLKQKIDESANSLCLFDIVFRIIVKNKIKWLHGKAMPQKTNDGRVVWGGVIIDITTQKLLEQELVIAEREKQEEKLANTMKTRFLGSLSHELRTPLNSINGFSEILLNDLSIPKSTLKEFLTEINKSGEHLLQLINAILDIAKIEQEHTDICLTPVNIADLLTEIRNSFEPLLSKVDGKINFKLPQEETILHTDKTMLRQVLINVIHNAIKYSKDIVSIEIKMTKQQKHVNITITDQGIGIAPDDHNKIFNAFCQINPINNNKKWGDQRQAKTIQFSSSGRGLGLYITKQLIGLLQGSIAIKSPGLGLGTTVKIRLPNSEDTEAWDYILPSN